MFECHNCQLCYLCVMVHFVQSAFSHHLMSDWHAFSVVQSDYDQHRFDIRNCNWIQKWWKEGMGWNVATTVMWNMSSGNHDMVKTWLRNKQQSANTYIESVMLKHAITEKQITCEWCHGYWMLWMGREYAALNFCGISTFGDFFGLQISSRMGVNTVKLSALDSTKSFELTH